MEPPSPTSETSETSATTPALESRRPFQLRRPTAQVDPQIVKDGGDLWRLIRNSSEPLDLNPNQILTLQVYLRRVLLPRLEPVEKEAGGGQGWEDPDKHPLQVRERVTDEKIKEQLNELHDARDVLDELCNPKLNTVPPSVPNASQAENKFDPNRAWVLIIGNNSYVVKPLAGCVSDAREVETYVKDTLKVDPGRILKLENAKREQMIDALHTHFGKAQSGDALLFFFAGHGATYSLYNTPYEASGAAIEALCPSDRGLTHDEKVVPDISDRELNTIFSIHAARVGPNITAILDCCHSGGVQRKGMSRFKVYDEHGEELDDGRLGVRQARPLGNGLEEMLARMKEDTRFDWGALGTLPTDSAWKPNPACNVLIAASQDFERSREDPVQKKGLFTRRLLEVLAYFPAKNFSYNEILRCIGPVLPDAQNPALLGDKADSLFLQIGY